MQDVSGDIAQTAAIRTGTAGWGIAARHADDFSARGSHLVRYAQRLNAVEINSSFYRPHRPATYARWAASVPPTFRFAVKVPRIITHEHRLHECDEPIARFAREVGHLGARLGALLVQLPPSLPFAATAAAAFDALQQSVRAPVVCEPRHASWFSAAADQALAGWGVARVAADPPPVPGADRPGGWRGLCYVRLHGSPQIYHSIYDDDALARIAEAVRAQADAGIPIWCIFDNTALGHALGNALALQGRLSTDDHGDTAMTTDAAVA